MKFIDKLSTNMPNDVTLTRLRTVDFNSSGGSKIFLTSNIDRFQDFFGNLDIFEGTSSNFVVPIECKINKDAILNYLHILFFEYKSNILQKYNNVDLRYWIDIYEKLSKLQDEELFFEINSVTKRQNGNLYIQGKDDSVFGEYLYKILLANISILEIDKYEIDEKNLFIFKPYVNISKKMIKNVYPLLKVLNINKIEYSFEHKNILFKGVPGTGKSHAIDKIIKEKLTISDKKDNILRINIHSASSNADLMQGIAITTENEQVSYKEKQGLIFKHIQKACYSPYEPFVLVLEEIQENSLNELIGDLIYLIEPSKRVKVQDIKEADIKDENYEYEELIELYLKKLPDTHFVEIPNLVSINSTNRKMIMPNNLYIFCTSNYRGDKKVIEDNLLRRFDVIEVYPQYKDTLGNEFKSQKVSDFLENLNEFILKTFDSYEIHPDRFLIGHANWLNIDTMYSKEFYKAVLKVVIEFKEIREIDFKDGIAKIFNSDDFSDEDKIDLANYKSLVSSLQKIVYKDILE